MKRRVLSWGRVGSGAVVSLVLTLPLASAATETGENSQAGLLFNTASRLYRQENWRDAAAAFGKFLDRFSKHKDAQEARFARGYCFNRLGDHVAAVRDLRLARRGRDARWAADANFYLGRSLETLAESPKAGAAARVRFLLSASTHYREAAELHVAALEKVPATDAAQRRKLLELYVSALGSGGAALYHAGEFGRAVAALDPLLQDVQRLEKAASFSRGLYFLALAHYAEARRREEKGVAPDFHAAVRCLAYVTSSRFERDPLWPEAAYLLARDFHDHLRILHPPRQQIRGQISEPIDVDDTAVNRVCLAYRVQQVQVRQRVHGHASVAGSNA